MTLLLKILLLKIYPNCQLEILILFLFVHLTIKNSNYQNTFSLPEKISLNIKPANLNLIKQAVNLKFGKKISISTNINSNIRKVAKLAKLNAYQVIENRLNRSARYSFAIKDLIFHLACSNKDLSIEGFDVSHHAGKDAVASLVRFSGDGPEKSKYRLFNIPKEKLWALGSVLRLIFSLIS